MADLTAIDPNTGRAYGFGTVAPPEDVPGTPATPASPAAVIPQNTQEAAALAAFDETMAPPESPARYRVPSWPGGAPLLAPEHVAEVTTAAHTLGYSQGEFERLVAARDVAQRDQEAGIPREAYSRRNLDDLKRRWGSSFDSKLNLARQEAARMMQTSPLFRDMLADSHFGSNRIVIEILAARGEFNARKR